MITIPTLEQTKRQRGCVFGPKLSRRLGRSLAVDVIPRKACPLDCVYCELGRTDHLTIGRREYVPAEMIIDDLRKVLSRGSRIDHITLSASGEPTLNSKLGEIIRTIKQMTAIPVAILTNGVLLDREDVRSDLLEADVVLPSLDAASEEVFRRINRPHHRLELGRIIDGLIRFRDEYRGPIWLEILFVKGLNDSEAEIRKLAELVRLVRPERIQLNTVVRRPAEPDIEPLSPSDLRAIARVFGARCEVV